ncbi:cytochrome bo3 quinol oxidase subunit 2 [Novosphingobium sp. PhB165]|uniref:ubiquinol oxidase subunit II n=1 Tax=Novosphingobium sp. PhB165 TaxID=2485105 RepID=UPI0010474DAB|nr:ubiquinol oxidase subunit II [Novosphingobium sp. PhB165]TCM19746.1 cytochrome bo3 quinol oxidase subunit 2 [Novosphingobium sp. PhB165]
MRPPESRPKPRHPSALAKIVAALSLTGALTACNSVVLSPSGDVAQQQGDLVVTSTLLMLIIILPVMAATAFFAWHYRASNKEARYDPHWDHSTQLELLIWAAPLLIIICLGAITWVSTHLLDPYRTIGRIDAATAVPADAKPLEVEVVALDWKWLFIYPEQGVATVNELVVPTNRPLQFKITSSSVMNSFFVPAMAGQIYAMPGMETRLHAVINHPGEFIGFSANYSGAGFSHMRFATHAVTDAGFDQWAQGVKAGGQANAGTLDRAAYLQLEKPSEKVPVMRFASVSPDLYNAILNMCVEPGKMCMSDMMAIDARGGLGKEGIRNVQMLAYDRGGRQAAAQATANPTAAMQRELAWVRALCRQNPGSAPDHTIKAPASPRVLSGAGLSEPQSAPIFSHGQEALAAPAQTPAHPTQISRN